MEILKFRGAPHQRGEFPFTIVPDGGLVVIPLSATTSAIARMAGTSESQLIKHFGSKEGLLEAIYDEAWQRLNPGMQRVNLPNDKPGTIAMPGSERTAVFVKDACEACGQLVQRLQSSGAEFDLYMVGSRQDDARIRDWAKRANVDPARVRSGSITLNHDGGRWLSLGLPGDLPAVVYEVQGQWQRQP